MLDKYVVSELERAGFEIHLLDLVVVWSIVA